MSMRRLLYLVFLLTFVVTVASSAETQAVNLYVQFIRGTNDEKPKERSWKPIGPKLSKRLSPVFQWKNYWEMSLQEITVERRKVNKISLNKVRDLEIRLVNEKEIEFRLYRKGQLTRTSRQQINSKEMEIIGGTQDDETSWFVVVRHDKPLARNQE